MPDLVYKDPPPAGPIHTRIINARPHLKNIAQAASLMTSTVRSVRRGEDVITIVGQPRLKTFSHPGGYQDVLLEMDIELKRKGEVVPLDNPYQFYNCPWLTPDGTFHKDEAGNDVPNFTEDMDQVLSAILLRLGV